MLKKFVWAVLLFGISPPMWAQVRVTVPATRFNSGERIIATVENNTKSPITVCIEFGRSSVISGTTEPTPIPFFFQAKSGNRWGTLVNGPDMGSGRGADEISAGESVKFPFALNETGKLRLVLRYWFGSRKDEDCKNYPDHAREVKSVPFVIEDRPSQ